MFARTERLTLRPGWPEDAIALTRAIAHESVVTKLARAPWPYVLGDAQMFLAREPDPAMPNLLVFDDPCGSPRLVGGIGIHPSDVGAGHELGFWFTPDVWGRGYATEAGRALVGIARHGLGLDRLAAEHFLDNPASGRVLEKLCFQPTGQIAPRFSKARGEEQPCALYELPLNARTGCAPPISLAA